MTFSLLLEAALRSFLLALAVWAGLRIFRVRNVLAQKAAWGMVLAAALVMPVVLPMAAHWSVLPANVRVVIPADPETLLEELQARIQARPSPDIKAAAAAVPVNDTATSPDQPVADSRTSGSSVDPGVGPSAPKSAMADSAEYLEPQPVPHYASAPILDVAARPAAARTWSVASVLAAALLLYLAVAAVLLIRVFWGLMVALRLWHAAKPVSIEGQIPGAESLEFDCGGKIRSSSGVASPVTICSTIVLPEDYPTWDSEKLRIVLAHERSHIRQGDFYLQLFAGVYAAVVWFSPLGWWLKRQLSDLAEAISDRAGLEEAADRTSYAQVLLEFAAAPRPTLIGVAMARSGSLSRRIERLLNDVSFSQAFHGTRRSLAVLVIPVILFAASALVRVQAAGQAPAAPPAPPAVANAPAQAAPPAPATPAAPETGVSTPEPASADEPVLPASPDAPPAQVRAPQIAPLPPEAAEPPVVNIAPVAPVPGRLVLIAPKAPGEMGKLMVLPARAPRAPNSIAIVTPRASFAVGTYGPYGYGIGYGVGTSQSTTTQTDTVVHTQNGKHYRHSWSSDGNEYAIVHNNDSKETMSFNGDIHTNEIDKARKQAHGDFLWFMRGDKAYIVDDPATLSQIEAMYKPMEELGRQQEELGKKQEVLGKQQEDLGKQQENASVPTPDMTKEIAKIDAAMAKLKASQGKNMTQDEFSELQERIGELQGRLGEIQGQIGEKQGQFGERMGELGERMGELGAQMGELGARQGKIAQDADQRVRAIIDESMKSGKAHPVQ